MSAKRLLLSLATPMGRGRWETVNSASVGPVTNVNDAPGGSVSISGVPTEDQVLTAGHTLTDDDGVGTVSYQWQRNGANVVGAIGNTYTLSDDDVGTNVSVIASYTDGHGTIESVSSLSVGPVANVNDDPFGAVTISGTPVEDATLTAGHSLTDADGPGTVSYQWQRGGVDVAGAVGATYTPGDADVGQAISVVASYTDGGGTLESISSSAVGPIANVNDAPAGSVTISGTPTEDQLLTAAHTLVDADGLGVIGYQWQRDGVDITGATGTTYRLSDPDVGALIRVVAAYVDGNGTLEMIASGATGPIANVNDAPKLGPVGRHQVSELSSVGTAVVRIPASDADVGDVLTFAITGGDPDGTFVIDGDGTIPTARRAGL